MSRVHLVKPERLRPPQITWSLLRAPKGPHDILFLDGWETITPNLRTTLRAGVYVFIKGLNVPYQLHWKLWVCFWDFHDEAMRDAKDWFDQNAAEGHYPEIRSYHPERSE